MHLEENHREYYAINWEAEEVKDANDLVRSLKKHIDGILGATNTLAEANAVYFTPMQWGCLKDCIEEAVDELFAHATSKATIARRDL